MKFWEKVKCFFGFHKMNEPYFHPYYRTGKRTCAPKSSGIVKVHKCANCYYRYDSLTDKTAPYFEVENVVKELNRKKTPLEELL